MEVRLIGYTQFFDGEPEDLLEYAGRVCYRSEGNLGKGEFLRKRMEQGHLSLLEHGALTFEITGGSRAFTHQLVRHRVASYSQESQRYCEPEERESWVVPPEIQGDPASFEIFCNFLDQVAETYAKLRSRGIKKEDARYVLPNSATSKIIVTMNCRELLHFFEVRTAPEAQWEIREVANKMLELARLKFPTVFGNEKSPD